MGFGQRVAAAQEQAAARRTSGGYGARLFLKLDDGEEAVVRFLEEGDDVASAYFHKVDDGSKWGTRIICLNQDLETGEETGDPCPGCEQSLSRSYRGFFNLIWREAPVFERTAEGKLVKKKGQPVVEGYEDQVALWETNEDTVFDLYDLELTYKGLKSRDFVIKRRGTGINTVYSIMPADPDGGPKKMSKADLKLAEEDSNDLSKRLEFPEYDEWEKGPKGNKSKPKVDPRKKTSPFMRKRSEAADDDSDDNEDDSEDDE